MKRLRLVFVLIWIVVVSCTSAPSSQSSIDEVSVNLDAVVNLEDVSQPADDSELAAEDAGEEDTYSIYTDPCVECKWYFCPPLDAVWQKQICINSCEDPPVVVYESECVEYLECDPSQAIMATGIPCVTDDGYPGTQDKICNKGTIQYTSCVTECDDEICNGEDDDCDGTVDEGFSDIVEECNNVDDNCNGVVDEGEWECDNGCGPAPNLCVAGKFVCTAPLPDDESCDGEDNDCDGQIDEGQLNDCNMCGIEPEEVCNGIDDDCNGDTDEDLINPCSTACGEGYEICNEGSWISCTAPPVYDEICDGLDNDCDGQIDEELQCVCTVQDVGTLFPCSESPLLCGQGYKTCDCLDSECKTIVTTPCYAICYWLADPWGSDPNCDPHVGMALSDEKCNNFDDDCDQAIDEDLFSACYTGPESTLYVGICEPGEMTCDAGTWGHYNNETQNFIPGYCKDEVTPQPEVCNGEDDDCDGEVDWGEELKDTDVLFIVDWSGSMSDEIYAVMTALNQFAQNFSDEDVVKWAFMRGPVAVLPSTYDERLELQQDLIGFTDYLASLAAMDSSMQLMSTAHEMILDAIYISVHNITATLPQPISSFEWAGSGGIGTNVIESVPPLQDFDISWRPGADRIIIVFSDEYPQSYLNPKLDLETVKTAVSGTPQLKLYTFSRAGSDKGKWEQLASAGNGSWYKLTNNPTEMYVSLMEILDEICASGN